MADATLLSDVDRWVGVGIALVGSVVVAPEGTVLLLRSTREWVGRRASQMRTWLARVLPFLRRRPKVISVVAADAAISSDSATVSARGWVWMPAASVDERLEALRQHLTDVEGRIDEVGNQLRAETAARERAVAELETGLKTDLAELRRLLSEQECKAARIDARGLPVVGFGILLSGVPDELASIPLGLGWAWPAVGIGAAVVVGTRAFREHQTAQQVTP